MSEILNIASWYLAITLIGLTALPVALRFFPGLPNRGFALARPLGLLLWGFVFWLLTSLGILQNDLGGEILAYAALLAVAVLALRGEKYQEILNWIKQNKRTLLVIEGLFLLTFLFWALIRGMNPEVVNTEKPMELAFINSILRSPTFPPQDPWLSGYAISYYYFGYVMIAMLSRLTGVASAVAFNLSSALWFAMTAVAVYGIVYDIIALWAKQRGKPQEKFSRKAGLLGPLFMLIISTVEGVLEFLHAGGVFWKSTGDGALTSKFWSWLSILDLNEPPDVPFDWIPSRSGGWLWWRGSRVIQDMTLGGTNIEVIDEFPFFSYLLSDLHPHVLAMPFALLAIAISMNLFVGADSFIRESRSIGQWIKSWNFWLTALILGSLGFINTWDFPIYVGLFCLVWAFQQYQSEGWYFNILWDFLKNGLVLGITGALLFLPFYLGFASQAGGILPSLEFMTRGVHFWVLFAALLVPVLAFCLYVFKNNHSKQSSWAGIKTTLILLCSLFALSMLYGGLILSFQQLGPQLAASANPSIAALGTNMSLAGSALAGVHGNYQESDVLTQAILRRVQSPGTWLTLGSLMVLVLGVLFNRRKPDENEGSGCVDENHTVTSKNIELFILILVLFGVLLTVFPEYFYLRDQFGWRMNTIFKFYFQAWIFWSIAAAAGSAILFHQLRGWRASVFQVVWIVILIAGLAYPTVMLWNKTGQFSMKDWTLNGNAYIQRSNPDEYDAIVWLQKAPLGVVTEAVGGSYTDYARVSTRSGLPTVLGWPGHESQWRGGGEEMGSRYGDIQNLYETRDWTEASRILESYHVRYVYVGSLERSTYQVNTGKFDDMLTVVYRNDNVIIYEVPVNSGVPLP